MKEKMENTFTDLKRKWRLFLYIILDPFLILLIIITICLIYFSSDDKNKNVYFILIVLSSISCSFIGALIYRKWEEFNDKPILIARGKSAIRNLKLLMSSIAALEKRVKIFLFNLNDAKNTRVVTSSNLEEIIDKCITLKEETINSIENWIDIIPEADVTTQIGTLSDLNNELNNLKKEVIILNNEKRKKDKEKEKDTNLIKQLNNKISEKEKQMESKNDEILNLKKKIDNSILGGITSTTIGVSGYSGYSGMADFPNKLITFMYKCDSCGKAFTSPAGLSALSKHICPECQAKQ